MYAGGGSCASQSYFYYDDNDGDEYDDDAGMAYTSDSRATHDACHVDCATATLATTAATRSTSQTARATHTTAIDAHARATLVDDDDEGDDAVARSTTTMTVTTAPMSTTPTTLDMDGVLTTMQGSAADLAERAGVSTTASTLLLQRYGWSVEKALAAFADDPDEVMARLRLDGGVAARTSRLRRSTDAIECAVCTEHVDAGAASGLVACGHYFCHECWRDMLRHAIDNHADLSNLRCLAHDCAELIDVPMVCDAVFMRPGNGDDEGALRDKLRRAYAGMYVDAAPRLRWCANPQSCDAVVCVPDQGLLAQTVTCGKCDYAFCFKCVHEPHEPATCENVRAWEAKTRDGESSVLTIMRTTKPCPRCHMPIEKNYGCNHMTCWSGCQHEFCWICLGDWKTHTACRATVDSASSLWQATLGARKAASLARQLNTQQQKQSQSEQSQQYRFLVAYDAFIAHKQSSKDEARDVAACLVQVKSLASCVQDVPPQQSAELALREWLDVTARTLKTARQLLAYACVYGCFVDTEQTESRLLDQTRWKLQRETEQLSGLLQMLIRRQSVRLPAMHESVRLVQSWAAMHLFD